MDPTALSHMAKKVLVKFLRRSLSSYVFARCFYDVKAANNYSPNVSERGNAL